jgi:hypothetical protein
MVDCVPSLAVGAGVQLTGHAGEDHIKHLLQPAQTQGKPKSNKKEQEDDDDKVYVTYDNKKQKRITTNEKK